MMKQMSTTTTTTTMMMMVLHLEPLPSFVDSKELQDVVVAQLSQIIDLLLGEPALLVLEGKDLHCHHLFCNLPFPHCSKPPSSLDLKQLHWPVGQCWCRW